MRLTHETANAIIRLANNITTKDQTRHNLTYVEIRKLDDENHVELSATDGHIAVWVKIKDEALASRMTRVNLYFNRDHVDLLKALIKGSIDYVDFDKLTTDVKFPNMNQFRITDTKWVETVHHHAKIAGLEINRSFTLGFNIKFMSRIEKAFAPTKSGGVKMTMDTRDKLKPFLIRSTHTELTEEAVIMPMRV